MSARRVIAIDGAAGSGKSTLARSLARRLALPYVNTGLMYRALAAAALRENVDPGDERGLVGLARGLRFTIGGDDPPELEVEGYRSGELTSVDVESTVSAVARHPGVRALLRAAQRAMGEPGAVVEGRDIGSVVFPDAAVKLFLSADAGARATRRAQERVHDLASVGTELYRRDTADALTNPLVPPPGAEILDTGVLDIHETRERALHLIRERAPWLLGETPR